MNLAAICFDATGTLIETAEPVGEVYHRVARKHGVDLPAWRLQDAFGRILRHAPARGLEGETPEARSASETRWWAERIRQTFQATDSTARFDDFPAFATCLFDHYRRPEAWRTRNGVREMLAQLHAGGWPMGITSNFDHRLAKVLQGLELKRFFKCTIIPSTCGAAKPDRRVFERASEELGLPLERLAYVGDDAPETLETIERLGIRVFDVRRIESWQSFADLLDTAATLRPKSGQGTR